MVVKSLSLDLWVFLFGELTIEDYLEFMLEVFLTFLTSQGFFFELKVW